MASRLQKKPKAEAKKPNIIYFLPPFTFSIFTFFVSISEFSSSLPKEDKKSLLSQYKSDFSFNFLATQSSKERNSKALGGRGKNYDNVLPYHK